MKKVISIALLSVTAFAGTTSDIAITAGHESYDDPRQVFYNNSKYYGVRAGVYVDDSYGFQLGYERDGSANCQGMKIGRVYANALLMTKLANGLKPYALAMLGHESSNKDYQDSQAVAGVGIGARYDLENNLGAFLETKYIKRLKGKDHDIATTLGLTYSFSSIASAVAPVAYEQPQAQVQQAPQVVNEIRAERKVIVDAPVVIASYEEAPAVREIRVEPRAVGNLFVQVEALRSSSPKPMIKRLKYAGFSNASVKKKGLTSYVVVGPYSERGDAQRALNSIKRVQSDAFIAKF